MVPRDARRQHVGFPRAGRHLEALQLRDGRGQSGAAFALRSRGHMVPAQQKPHEILSRHRLDLAAQALLRVDVNAQQQPARAPLLSIERRIEGAAQRESLPLEARQRHRRESSRHGHLVRKVGNRHRPEHLQVSPQRGGGNLVAIRARPAGIGVDAVGPVEARLRIHRLDAFTRFHRTPQLHA